MKTRLQSPSESRAVEDATVVAWRRCCLLDAGFDAHLADELARSRGVDLHALLDLVDRGCAPDLAARILAPLERVVAGADP